MNGAELRREPVVSTRIHYMIADGRIELPLRERAEIIEKKKTLHLILLSVLRFYIALLSRGMLREAEEVMLVYRGLGEVRFTELFEKYGYPDELDSGAADFAEDYEVPIGDE